MDSSLYKIFKGSHCLLDTNIFIDLIKEKNSFISNIIAELTNQEVTLMTIDLCIDEFLKGTRTQEELSQLEELTKALDLSITPRTLLINSYKKVIIALHGKSAGIPLADLYLFAALVQYSKSNIYLMTKDIKDFPESNFERVVLTCYEKDNQVYPVMIVKLKYDIFNKSLNG